MLPEQVLAVIIPIRRADGGVNMVASRFSTAPQSNGALVIKLDQHDRTVNAVEENGVLLHFSNPGEMGLVQVRFDFRHLHFGVPFSNIADPLFTEVQKFLLLLIVQFRHRDSFVGNDYVVAECFGFGIRAILHGLQHRFLLLGISQTLRQRETGILLFL